MSDDIAPVKRRRNRLYVPLDVEFATDPKILDAGPLAAYLYVCSLAYCKRSDEAGNIHRSQLRVLALGLPGRAQQYADTLVKVGLWAETPEGWEIPSWLKHNLSPDQLEDRKATAKAKSELGNHRRHHEQKGVRVADCSHCYPPEGVPNPSPRGEFSVPTGNVNSPEVEKREHKGTQVEGTQGNKTQAAGDPVLSSHRGTPNAAAAALRILLEHKITTENPRSPDGYRTSVGPRLRDDHRAALAAYLDRRPHATADELAAYVLNVPGLTVTQSEARRDWYADPQCEHCDGDGLTKLDDGGQGTYGPCPCRRADPYPRSDETPTEDTPA